MSPTLLRLYEWGRFSAARIDYCHNLYFAIHNVCFPRGWSSLRSITTHCVEYRPGSSTKYIQKQEEQNRRGMGASIYHSTDSGKESQSS